MVSTQAQHGAGQANMALLRGGGFAGVVEICPKPMMYKSIFQCLAALRGVRYFRVEHCAEINHWLGYSSQTSNLSSSVKSKSIRLIFGRIDCSC